MTSISLRLHHRCTFSKLMLTYCYTLAIILLHNDVSLLLHFTLTLLLYLYTFYALYCYTFATLLLL